MLNTSKSFLRLYFSKHQRYYAAHAKDALKKVISVDVEHGNIKSFETKIEELKDRLLYSTYLEDIQESYGTRINYAGELEKQKYEARVRYRKLSKNPLPLVMQYLDESKQYFDEETDKNPNDNEIQYTPLQFPYDKKKDSKMWMKDYDYFDDTKLSENNSTKEQDLIPSAGVNTIDNQDNEHHMQSEESEEESDNEFVDETYNKTLWLHNYGKPDPSAKISQIPCGGCGALLHSKDTSFPGYLPAEIFNDRTDFELKATKCQRCHFLQEYNVALNVSVDPSEYPKLLMKLRPLWALSILMVDILDFPCSIWPGIMSIVGKKRPVIIVGNKVDLLPQDSSGYLLNVTKSLTESINNSSLANANIKHIALISAKTGFGVEELINKMHNIWECKGDVFLIGCTNVGKSTLFNALLQSDYCRVRAVDLMQRSTVSQWPGTTLNLLKFPIMYPADWILYLRTKRLQSEQRSKMAEARLRQQQLKITGNPKYATLIGHIGKTLVNPDKNKEIGADPFSYQMTSGFKQPGPEVGVNENSKFYRKANWCYDTPGVIHPDQILSLLTLDELMLTLPKYLIRPRTFYLTKGSSIFIAGLARLDFVEAEHGVRFTVFASHHLPITVCRIQDADEIYSSFLGTDMFLVPIGGEDRLAKWPKLEKHSEEFEREGVDWNVACCDVLLSSAGWVSVTPKKGDTCRIAAWTPEARGIYLRTTPLIKYSVKMKGARVKGTPAYTIDYNRFESEWHASVLNAESSFTGASSQWPLTISLDILLCLLMVFSVEGLRSFLAGIRA